jgi:hypothetical protein
MDFKKPKKLSNAKKYLIAALALLIVGSLTYYTILKTAEVDTDAPPSIEMSSSLFQGTLNSTDSFKLGMADDANKAAYTAAYTACENDSSCTTGNTIANGFTYFFVWQENTATANDVFDKVNLGDAHQMTVMTVSGNKSIQCPKGVAVTLGGIDETSLVECNDMAIEKGQTFIVFTMPDSIAVSNVVTDTDGNATSYDMLEAGTEDFILGGSVEYVYLTSDSTDFSSSAQEIVAGWNLVTSTDVWGDTLYDNDEVFGYDSSLVGVAESPFVKINDASDAFDTDLYWIYATDTDGDGEPDNTDTDDDNDGVDAFPDDATETDGDGIGDNTDTDTDTTDNDGDGYADYVDCNDNDESINPGADEVCDNVDNDCDGSIDNDASDAKTFYADSDGDGHGDDDNGTSTACVAPEGFVVSKDDCDDSNEDVNPDSTSIYKADRGDGSFDYNCDGKEDKADKTQAECGKIAFGESTEQFKTEGWVLSESPDCGESDSYCTNSDTDDSCFGDTYWCDDKIQACN